MTDSQPAAPALDLGALPVPTQPVPESTGRLVWKRFRRHLGAQVGSLVLLILVLAVLLARSLPTTRRSRASRTVSNRHPGSIPWAPIRSAATC